MIFLDRLNSLKFDFTQNLSDGKIIKFQQSQALTSHFESFWSIVQLKSVFLPYKRLAFFFDSCFFAIVERIEHHRVVGMIWSSNLSK